MKNTMKTGKKFLSLVLAVIMIVCTVPMTFAEGNTYKVGDIIQFGSYPQSKASDGTYQTEPIEWRILSISGNTALLLSDKILDYSTYHSSWINITWEKSKIRTWLNNTFYNKAFNEDEKQYILLSDIANEDNPTYNIDAGNDTTDKIFLLSLQESINGSYGFLSRYDEHSSRVASATDYAVNNGVYVRGSNNVADWWLRTPGSDASRACVATDRGYTHPGGAGVAYQGDGVRPAMRIDLDAIKEENIYNLGEETYSFENYWDFDSFGGHCFGMSVTSSGYYLGMLKRNNADVPLYEVVNAGPIRVNICHYQGIQGSIRNGAYIAGGIDIDTDWEEIIDVVDNHDYDAEGALVIVYKKEGEGVHAVNFLRYEEVDGQERLYAYDSNFPKEETYFYKDENGDVRQAVHSTFSGDIDAYMAIMSVSSYLLSVSAEEKMKKYQMLSVYYSNSSIDIQDAKTYQMACESQGEEFFVYELPEGTTTVKITPLIDNATFTYMGQEYSFGEIDEDTYAEFTLSTSEEDTPEFEIVNAPEVEPSTPDEPDTPSEPADDCSCNCHAGGIKAFFFKIINFFQKLFGINKVCACGVKH